MDIRRWTTALATIGLVLAPSGALAQGNPWTPYRGADFQLAAGERCDFPVTGVVTEDKERIRTTETYPDGSPKVQKIVGQLKIELTNDDTGSAVERNYTGNGIVEHGPDGSFSLRLQGGHMMVGLRPEDATGPALVGLTGSSHELHIAADGTRTLTLGNGPVEDLCATLSGG